MQIKNTMSMSFVMRMLKFKDVYTEQMDDYFYIGVGNDQIGVSITFTGSPNSSREQTVYRIEYIEDCDREEVNKEQFNEILTELENTEKLK